MRMKPYFTLNPTRCVTSGVAKFSKQAERRSSNSRQRRLWPTRSPERFLRRAFDPERLFGEPASFTERQERAVEPVEVYKFDHEQHQNTLRVAEAWSECLARDGVLEIEVERMPDVPQCAVVMAAMRGATLEHSDARDVAIQFTEFGRLMRLTDGSSFRAIRFRLTLSPDVLLHRHRPRRLTGGRFSDFTDLSAACVTELANGRKTVLECLGYAAFYRTFHALRRVNRQLSGMHRLFTFALITQRRRQERSSKTVIAFEFHLHATPFEVERQLPIKVRSAQGTAYLTVHDGVPFPAASRKGDPPACWIAEASCRTLFYKGCVSPVRKAASERVPPYVRQYFRAFYSSELDGIIRDASLMTLPIDDRLFLHGHGASEMCHIAQGYLYLFEEHLERFLWSVARAGLKLPMSEKELKKTILHTAAAGNKLNGFVRFWLTGGRGTLGMSVRGGKGPSLYVLSSCEKPYQDYDLEKGFKVKTSKIPVHDTYYTTLQSNGNLPAVLSQLDAERQGLDLGILVDEDLNVIHAGDYDVGILTPDDVLVTTPSSEYLMSTTLQRILKLLKPNEDPAMAVRAVESRLFSVEEAQRAKEVFVVHPHLPVMGVVEWDGVMIGDGTSGSNTAGLSALLVEDSEPRENSFVHTEIPYGYMTM